MLVPNNLDAKVVDNKREEDRAGSVAPEAGCMADRGVAVRLKVGNKTFVGKLSSLGKDVHAFLDFNNDVAIVDEGVGYIVA